MREGYDEIMVNHLGDGIQKQIKVCDGCVHLKHQLIKSGRYPIYWNICLLEKESENNIGYKMKSRLHENVYGYIEPPGLDGEDCPFHKQLLRNKNIKNILTIDRVKGKIVNE